MLSGVERQIIDGVSQDELTMFFDVIEKMKNNLITISDKNKFDN